MSFLDIGRLFELTGQSLYTFYDLIASASDALRGNRRQVCSTPLCTLSTLEHVYCERSAKL